MAYELFCESFDTTASVNANRWIASGNTSWTTIDSTNGRRGSQALKQSSLAGNSATVTSFTFTPSTHGVWGFCFRRTVVGVSGTSFIILSDATTQITLTLLPSGVFSVTLGGITYNSTKSYVSGSSVYIEIGFQIADAGQFYVKVNGKLWIDLSSVDTKPSTPSTFNQIRFVNNNTINTVYYDDLYLTYGDELKWLGDIRVDALALTADSTPQDWTPDTGNAWGRLNNASAGYITGTTLDDESLFALADYTPVTTAIHGVQVSAYARKTDAGSRSMAIEVKSDTTTDVGDTIALGDTTTEYRQVWLTDPDTAAAWTDGGLNALEIGVKVMD